MAKWGRRRCSTAGTTRKQAHDAQEREQPGQEGDPVLLEVVFLIQRQGELDAVLQDEEAPDEPEEDRWRPLPGQAELPGKLRPTQ